MLNKFFPADSLVFGASAASPIIFFFGLLAFEHLISQAITPRLSSAIHPPRTYNLSLHNAFY